MYTNSKKIIDCKNNLAVGKQRLISKRTYYKIHKYYKLIIQKNII